MGKSKKLVLFGDSAFAEIAYEYFTHDSEYEVVAFTVSQNFITKKELFGLPVIAFEEVGSHYPPANFDMYIALAYSEMNRRRMQFYTEAKQKGYAMANYVSSRAFVWHNVTMGDNCFIFEDNTVQPFVTMGSNNVLWSGNNIGHHSKLGDHNFISSHVVISGFCAVGNSNFMGVNSTVANNINIGSDCLIGASANIVRDVPDGSFIKPQADLPGAMSTWEKFKLK